MPLYEYQCEACDHRFEIIQKFSDAPIAVCPKCGAGPVVKLLSSPAIQFKGSGWYITDYARKDQGAAKASSDGGKEKDATPASTSGEAAKDTKPAATTTLKTD